MNESTPTGIIPRRNLRFLDDIVANNTNEWFELLIC